MREETTKKKKKILNINQFIFNINQMRSKLIGNTISYNNKKKRIVEGKIKKEEEEEEEFRLK